MLLESKEEKIKEIFLKFNNKDTDWSIAADKFVSWNIQNDFKTESFKEFVEWLDNYYLNRTWYFFFGYGDDYESFADEWVEEEEQESYLNYCKEGD